MPPTGHCSEDGRRGRDSLGICPPRPSPLNMQQTPNLHASQTDRYRILVAASEAHPLIKTGGLADVAGSLPSALREIGHDARLILPAYPDSVRELREVRPLAELKVAHAGVAVQILAGRMPNSDLPVYLVDSPPHFQRAGNPYLDTSGNDWGDNPERFLLFSRIVARIAESIPALGWAPQVLHCNDWQTGPVAALLNDRANRPAVVFTIHNLAYQGLFPRSTFERLQLPESLWSVDGLEFHQQLSFIKGGLSYSDLVNTVSPTYAQEIKTPAFGCGLDGLVDGLGDRFGGILNGVDYGDWDPAGDELIAQPFDADSIELKRINKTALQRRFSLPADPDVFVFGYVGRLVEQKGVDLILDILPDLLTDAKVQLVMQCAGDRRLEQRLRECSATHPEQVAAFIGYDERGAHMIEAGSDAFLMPSRFEPCGLNQLYSLRYGTPPIVHRTGGLADTVVDTDEESLANGTATGFAFDEPTSDGLLSGVQRALDLYRQRPDAWRQIAVAGMQQDFSWQAAAHHYEDFYADALNRRRMTQASAA